VQDLGDLAMVGLDGVLDRVVQPRPLVRKDLAADLDVGGTV
jgi:hypothetical protein